MESSSISVLVNGSPTKKFKPSRGIRQENLIAPFLSGLVNQVARKEVFFIESLCQQCGGETSVRRQHPVRI